MTTFTRNLAWLEFLLTLLAVLTLIWLAQDLAAPSLAYGRNSIYQHAIWPSQAGQALWLQTHIGNVMTVVISCGALVLHLARFAIPTSGFLCGTAAIWFAALGAVQTTWPQEPQWQWMGTHAALVTSFIALAIWPFVTRGCKKVFPHLAPTPKQSLRSLWQYPLFALLTGIGVLIWLDYSARGPAKYHLMGVRQLYYWVGAVVTYTVMAGLRLPLLSMLAWVLSRADHVSAHNRQARYKLLRVSTVFAFVAWMAGIAALGQADKNLLAATSELLRAPIYILGAWALYRWYGQRGGNWSLRVWGWLLGLSLTLTLALAATHDNGPVLVMAYTAVVLSSVGGVTQWLARYPRIHTWASIVVAAGFVLAVEWALVGLASHLSEILHLRLQTLEVFQSLPTALRDHKGLPVSAYDFLLRLHWFIQNTPMFGFGLGHIPWCGYEGHIGGLCGSEDGTPWQTQSDYSAAALIGFGGPLLAMLMLTCLVIWFWRLLPQATDTTPMRYEGVVSLDAFGLWIVALFAISSLVQIGVTLRELHGLVYCSKGIGRYEKLIDMEDGGPGVQSGCLGEGYVRPTIKQSVFPNASLYVWSSLTSPSRSSFACIVNFYDGAPFCQPKSYEDHVRLVRSGQ